MTAAFRKYEALSATCAQMIVITGRRRIGKTTLIKRSFTKIPFLYFFVGKKSESFLCREFSEIVREVPVLRWMLVSIMALGEKSVWEVRAVWGVRSTGSTRNSKTSRTKGWLVLATGRIWHIDVIDDFHLSMCVGETKYRALITTNGSYYL